MVRFIPRYFILFEAIVNGIVFLISFSVSSLLSYKDTTDFWILTLYPATLLNSLISSIILWWNLWGSLCTVSCHLQIKTVFNSSSEIWMPLISSSSLISIARTSSTVINKRGESRHSCLVPDLKGNTCSFAH